MEPSNDIRLSGLRLLAADDHAVNRDFIRAVLGQRVAELALATNGREAVRACREQSYDVVLLDLHMPDLDGFAVREAIAELDPDQRTRVLALTADSRPEQRERLRRRGFHGVLHKPVSSPLLIDGILAAASGRIRFVELDDTDAEPAALLDDRAAARAAGGSRPVAEMRRALAAELDEHGPELDRLIASGAYPEAAQRLHQWAGAAGYTGARRFGEVSGRLERCLVAGLDSSPGTLYFEWRRTLAATTAALAAAPD